jgi:hypothetical protein
MVVEQSVRVCWREFRRQHRFDFSVLFLLSE